MRDVLCVLRLNEWGGGMADDCGTVADEDG